MTEPQPYTAAELDAVEARANAATPGPWSVEPFTAEGWAILGTCTRAAWWCRGMEFQGGPYGMIQALHRDDADFVAHAREDIPRFIATVREERRSRRFWQEAHDAACSVLDERKATIAALEAEVARLRAERDEAKFREDRTVEVVYHDGEIIERQIARIAVLEAEVARLRTLETAALALRAEFGDNREMLDFLGPEQRALFEAYDAALAAPGEREEAGR